MVFLLDRIKKAFSDSALQYEIFTGLQKEIGRELLQMVKSKDPCRRILDIGMGTGWLANRISHLFPRTDVSGIDIAPGMIEVAKKNYDTFRIVQANAQALPFKEKTFDLIVSNLAYQWVSDLPAAFQENYRCLNEQGMCCFTMFGYQTLDELFVSLKEAQVITESQAQHLFRLALVSDVEKFMNQSGFKNIETAQEIIKVTFADLLVLLKWLKKIGANVPQRRLFLGKNKLQRTKEYYQQRFPSRLGIYATFEVIWVKAVK